MKIAIVNQYSSAGGGARFVRALVTALAVTFPEDEVTVFADATAVERDDLADLFAGLDNVDVRPVQNGLAAAGLASRPRLWKLRQSAKRIAPVARFYYWLQSKKPEGGAAWFDFALDEAAIAQLSEFDVVHLAWPYFMEPAALAPPVVITMHDFNYKYPFGNFSDRMLELVERQTPEWLATAQRIVVSAAFIRDEFRKFYPAISTPVDVVRLTHFSITTSDPSAAADAGRRMGIPDDYMICASNTSKHKNLESLLIALAPLRDRGVRVPLVLAGYGTDQLGKHADSHFPEGHPLYEYQRLSQLLLDLGLEVGRDVIPLGYVSDADIDALIAGARLLVAPSLYEAGSGPAVDAWSVGTPVAFSDIPPFREHLDFLGVEAYLFDPHDPDDIAGVLAKALTDRDATRLMGLRSREAISRRTWEDIAREYRAAYQAAGIGRSGSVGECA